MGLSELQEERRRFDPVTAGKLDEFIAKLQKYSEGSVLPFTFEVYDPSGNSFIQNPNAPAVDENLTYTQFTRSLEDYQVMGYPVDEAALMIEQDKAILEGIQKENKHREGKKAVSQTKEE